MKRVLLIALAGVVTGCLGDDGTFEEFCEDRPDVCYGAGKGPYGTTPNGGGIIGGASSGPGINILRAAVGDNCSGSASEGITNEVRDQCDGKFYCRANAQFLYDSGANIFPSCDENMVVRYRCGGSSQEFTRETSTPYWGVDLYC